LVNIDRYAYASRLKEIDPVQKVFFGVLTLGVCLWADSILVSLCVLLVMTGQSVVKGKIPLGDYLKLMGIPMSFLLLGVLAVAVEVTGNPQNMSAYLPFFGGYLGVSHMGLMVATGLFFRALGAVSCLYYVSLNTPMVDILSALKKLKCPQLFIELMLLIYRFIFVLMETAETMKIAQNARLGYVNVFVAYRSLGTLASTLFVRAYKRSEEMFTALEARGYTGEIHVLEETKEAHRQGYLMAVAINALLIVLAFSPMGR